MIPGLDWICDGVSLARRPPIGLPGMSRGSRKFSVIATQMASA